MQHAGRLSSLDVNTPFRGPWDAGSALHRHITRMVLRAVPFDNDLAGRLAAAEVGLVVSTIICSLPTSRALAVHVEGSGVVVPARASHGILRTLVVGEVPIDPLVAFSTRAATDPRAAGAAAALTRGLLPFVGYEVVVAPRPGIGARAARDVAYAASLRILREGMELADGTAVRMTARGDPFVVQRLPMGTIGGAPVALLVGPSGLADRATLATLADPPA
ncbi:hypothetical protein [Acuticoccus sp.]|uniref:hypothetical protein n=1 Tax=Acuticoccus sp. TaxID=1904378 RepID=UPI003B515CEF